MSRLTFKQNQLFINGNISNWQVILLTSLKETVVDKLHFCIPDRTLRVFFKSWIKNLLISVDLLSTYNAKSIIN